MSAINDALRRASGAATGTAEPPPLPVEPPPPIPHGAPPLLNQPAAAPLGMSGDLPPLLEPAPKKKSSLLLMIIIVALFGIAGAAGAYLWKRNKVVVAAKTPGTEAVVRAPSLKQSEASKSEPAGLTKALPEKPASAPAVAAAAKPEPPAPTPSTPPATPRAPVQFPQLRLQGIYYRPSSPSVMINNRTLFIGDQVQGVTVASIDASSVTLVLSGQTNILTLR